MKILTVTHFYENHGGGIERVAANLCRAFASDGHDAAWAASDDDPPPDSPIEAVPLRCANPTEGATGLPMPVPGFRAMRNLVRAIGASDVVIVHDALYLTSILAMVVAKFRGKPVVLIQHIAGIEFASRLLRELMGLANLLVTRPMLHAADQLVFISNEVRRELLGEPADRDSLLLFNGVDTTIFHPRDASSRHAIRLRHGLPADSTIAIFVGRFVTKKGMAVLEALARDRPALHLALVGSGPVRPDSWDLPNVHVLGQLSQQTIAELFGASDLLLLPSVGEGYPLVIQEAMACGLSVICGDRTARADPRASQWLRGVKIELSDPRASASRCSAAIDSLLDTPPDRAEMANYAAKTYNWTTMARVILDNITPRQAGRLCNPLLRDEMKGSPGARP